MILEIDCGNTALKWRLSDGSRRGTARWDQLEVDGSADFTALALPEVSRVRLGSVAGDGRTTTLVGHLESHLGARVDIAQVRSGDGGVVCGYTEPSRLGVDRWLAVQAAMAAFPGQRLLVVDAGSAITVDACVPGRHLGGFIGPGLQLMRQALYSGTHAVKVPDLPVAMPVGPGKDTHDAVTGALALMLRGLVAEAAARLGAVDHYVMTGGAGHLLVDEFSPSALVPELVLDGLRQLLP